MKTLFIPVKSKSYIDKSLIQQASKKLPINIALCYSIQYLSQAKEIKSLLEKNHKITKFLHVLGCSKPIFPKQTKAILLITDGKFHAISLAHESKLPVYVLNGNKLEKVSSEEIENLEKKKKVSYVKFLNAKKIGILVSTKPGQQNMKKAIELKNKSKDKDSYLFISNNIGENEFENFPDIESWINTACPRIDMNEKGVVNIGDI